MMGTEAAFIAATWPKMIDHITMDPLRDHKTKRSEMYTLQSSFNAITASTYLSREQKTIIKSWRQSLGQPILEWQARVAKLRAVDISQIQEINRASKEAMLRTNNAKTQESISQSYLTYRTQLLATTHGGLFADLPSHLPTQNVLTDFIRIYNLRRLPRHKLQLIEQNLDTMDDIDHSALTKEMLELSVRITGLTVLLRHVHRSWEIDLDDRVRRAYHRLRSNLSGRRSEWPGDVGLPVLWRLTKLRTRVKEQLLEPQGTTLQKPTNERYLAALDEFFHVVENPASFKPNHRDATIAVKSSQPMSERRMTESAKLANLNHQHPRTTVASATWPASFQPSEVDALRRRIAALRSKSFEAPRDTSHDMIQDEIQRLEQFFQASFSSSSTSTGGSNAAVSPEPSVGRDLDDAGAQSSIANVVTESKFAEDRTAKRVNTIIRTVAGDHHNPQLLADYARRNIAKNKHLQWRETRRFGNNDTISTQPQVDARSPHSSVTIRKIDDDRASDLPLGRHNETKRFGEFERSGQDWGEMMEDMTPSKENGRVPFESAISPMFDSQSSGSQSKPPHNSDSAAISDLRTEVAELKDLIRGLLFQQMAMPGTNSEPPMLASTKADILAEISALAASVKKPTTKAVVEPLVASKEAPQASTDQASPGTLSVLEAPVKITYEMYPPDQDSQNTACKAPSQIVQHQTSQSLLAELFPEETKTAMAEERKERTGSPARIPIPHVPLTPIENSEAARRQSPGLGPVRRASAKGSNMTAESTVLELRYASKSLIEEDFRTLIPRGLHMQEWTQRGEFVKVIPKRDPWTLEQAGNYYIVFNNGEDAKAYKQHVSHVHDLARQHTPTSLTSEIAPPPGYIINGEDVSGLVQSYALIPPQQKLFLQYLVPPFTPLQQNIFKRGGYAQILEGGREGAGQVLLVFLEGRQPSYFEISDAIHVDGKRRGLGWKLLPIETAIRKVDMREPKKMKASFLDEDFVNDAGADALGGIEAAEGSKRKRTVLERAKTPTYGQRWILSFETVDEAKRFALQWHGRPFPWDDRAMKKRHERGFGEQVLMVRAEFLW